MPTPTVLSIDTISKEDVKAVFKDICDNYLVMDLGDVKRKYLGFAGTNDTINRKEINVHHLLLLCEKVGVSFKIECSYDRSVMTHDEVTVHNKVFKTTNDMRLCDSYNRLEQQKEEITNPELQDIVKDSVSSAVLAPENPDIEEIKPYQKKTAVPKFNL